MALDVLYTLPIADEQRQWLEIIKRNAGEAVRLVDDPALGWSKEESK